MIKNFSYYIASLTNIYTSISVLLFIFLCFSLNTFAQSPISTDFSDGTWGDLVAERPASGEYSSFEANGFTIRNGVLNGSNSICISGTKHVNRIVLDKNSTRAYISLPEVFNIGVLTVHVSTGSDNKSFIVQEKMGRAWETIGTYSTIKEEDSIYQIPIHKAKAQLRIANNTGSSLFIWQIETTFVDDDVIAAYALKRPVLTNLTDGTWGRPSSKRPETGEFPSFEANGFSVHNGALLSGSIVCDNDANFKHSGRVCLDKESTGAFIEFPEVKLVGNVEIHAATGSDDKSFNLQELTGKRWKTIATFSTTKKEQVFTYSAYRKIAKLRITNNTGSSLSIYHIKLLRTDAETIARQEKLTGLVTNFADGTWGEASSKKPESAEYPTFEANDYWIYAGCISTGSKDCSLGGKHQNRLILDKDKYNARIDFPELTDVGELEIHASSGSDDKSFQVLEKVGRKWEVLATFTTSKQEKVYILPVNKALARLRIRNNTSSSLNIYQIKMRTMTALNSLMLQASLPAEGELCYGNLTRNIILKFNKQIALGGQSITLNGEVLEASKIKIQDNYAIIRVKLSAGNSHKSYNLNIPSGAFISPDSVISEDASLSFKVHKTTVAPTRYTTELDAVYSNANIGQNRVDLYYPTTSDIPVPVVINIHGGGWNHGVKESQTGFKFYFENGMAVANMEYRMTEHAHAPAAIEDVRCMIHYLANNAQRLNIDPHKIILRGGSAGGHLALVAGCLGASSDFDKCMFIGAQFSIAAIIDNYAPTDLTKLKDYSSLREWVGDNIDDDVFLKSISPIYLINENTPPIYIIHGDSDPIIDYEQSVLFEQALKASGVKSYFRTVPDGKHGNFTKEYKGIMEEDLKQFLEGLGLM